MTKISAVIPAYNESATIGTMLTEVERTLSLCADGDYEIIVVDDHSSDDTFGAVKRCASGKARCIRLNRHWGSHVAIRAGLREARGESVLCISADGQDDPRTVGDMLAKARAGADIVWALRLDRNDEPWFIRKPSQLFYRILFGLLNARGAGIDMSRATFFLLNRKVVGAVNECPERNTSLFGLLVWLGFRQDYVEYRRRPRIAGASKWTVGSRIHLAKDWIIAFSGLPLKIASAVGLAISLAGVCYTVVIIFNKLCFNNTPPGWASIIVVILISSGIQLIILGVIGDYLWHNLDESRRRPLYFIESRTDTDPRQT